MAQTVIGLFDTAAEAQQAVESLTSKGFSRESIDISSAGSQSSSYVNDTDHEESGIGKFFRNLFSDDEDDSKKYSTVAGKSGSIVTVHAETGELAEDAADILDDCGAVNVDERAATYGYTSKGTTGTAIGTPDYSNTTNASLDYSNATADFDDTLTGDTKKIPIIEESLQVGKREVLTGGVRLRSRIVERPVEESLRLREESVRVERNSVDRIATDADLKNFEGTQIEMKETAEVPVVSKEARVVEEISLGKNVEERTETVSDTVRKTEVDIEDLTEDNLNKKY